MKWWISVSAICHGSCCRSLGHRLCPTFGIVPKRSYMVLSLAWLRFTPRTCWLGIEAVMIGASVMAKLMFGCLCIYIYRCTRIHVYTYVYVYVCTRVHARTYMHTCIYVYPMVYMYTCIYIYMHAYTRIHAYMHKSIYNPNHNCFNLAPKSKPWSLADAFAQKIT